MDVAGDFSTAGETRTVNVTMPIASMTLSGTVFTADGTTPIPNAYVQILNAAGTALSSFRTNASGAYGPAIFLGNAAGVTIRAYDPSVVVSASQVQLPGATGGTFTVNVTVPVYRGTIQGRVLAADGETGVASAYVSIVSGTTSVASFYAAADGSFASTTYLPTAGGILAVSYVNGLVSERTATSIPLTFASANATVIVNLTLPLSVVKGHAVYADGSSVRGFGTVRTVGDDSQSRSYQTGDPATGNFVILGTPTGRFTTYVTDSWSPYFTGFTDAVMGDITIPVNVEVTLPEKGTADVTLRDYATGRPVAYTQMALSAPGAPLVTSVGTDANGHALFTAPAGPVSFQACVSGGTCGIVSGTVVAGQTLALDLVPLPTATLAGQVFRADGVTPIANTNISLQSSAGSGMMGNWSNSTYTDSAGRFSVPGVPAGLVRVEAWDGESNSGIQVPVSVDAGKTNVMAASEGSGASWPTMASGQAAFVPDRYGRLTWASLGGVSNPYSYSYHLSVNDQSYVPGAGLARVTSPGTRFEFGPANSDALIVQRKVAVPGTKPYVRYIEVIRNPTGVPLPVSVRIDASVRSLAVVTAPAETGNRYLITGPPAEYSYGMVGHVVGGAGTPAVKPGIDLVADSSLGYVWATMVPPGGTVEFMHFSIIWDPADVAGLRAQAQALVDLSDPDALTGVSDEEKARIVNFTVPGGTAAVTGNIRGTVAARDGVTRLAGATVRAQDAFTGHLWATTATDANGAFALDNVPNGDHGVAVTAQVPGFPGESAGAAVTFSSAGQTVSGLALIFSAGEVTGLVTLNGTGSANPTVLVSQTDGSGTVTTLRASSSGADGRYVVLGLKPGAFTFTVIDASGQLGTTTPGWDHGTGSLTLNIDLPSAPSCVQSPTGLQGFWRGEAGAEDSVHPGSDGTLDHTAMIVPAKVGNGFGLDGNAAVVQVPDTGSLHPATITVSAWVSFNSLDSASTPQAGEQYIVFKKKGTIGPNGWVQGYVLAKTRGVDGLDRFVFYVVTPDEQDLSPAQVGTTVIEPGRFYHVVGTVDGTVGRLYVDGMLEATFPFAYPVDGGTGPLVIGGGDLGGWDPRLDGVVDEVQVFARALTVDEVQGLYAATSAGICSTLDVLPALLPATYVGVSTTDTLRAVSGVLTGDVQLEPSPPGLNVMATVR